MQRLIASWLWSVERVWGALEVLVERSAQPSLSWRESYKASETRVPACGLSKGPFFIRGLVVGILLDQGRHVGSGVMLR
jgi:hypothetical protein